MSRPLTFLALGLAGIFLAAGWLAAGDWLVGLGQLLAVLPLGLLLRRNFRASGGLALGFFLMAAAAGLWRGMPLALALAGVMSALAAWDLEAFSRRLALASGEDDAPRIERSHLARLALILALGAGFSLATQVVDLKFSFEWAAVLVMITFAGIGALIRWLRSREN
jgi:hypothetical protein